MPGVRKFASWAWRLRLGIPAVLCQHGLMEEQNGNSGPSRLDRIESLMERLVTDHLTFRDEHRALLTSQVLLTDRMDKLSVTMQELAESQKRTDDRLQELAESQKRTDDRLQELAESQKHTGERMGILIHMMDEFIRKRGESL
jgi:hypothetical protein